MTKMSEQRPSQSVLWNYCCPRKEGPCVYLYGQYVQIQQELLSSAFKRCFFCNKRRPFKRIIKCFGCDTIYHRGCGKKATNRRLSAVSAVVDAYREWCEELRAAVLPRHERFARSRCVTVRTTTAAAAASTETQRQKVVAVDPTTAAWDAFVVWCDETRAAQSSRREHYRARCGEYRETVPAVVDLYVKLCDEIWEKESSQWEWYRARRIYRAR